MIKAAECRGLATLSAAPIQVEKVKRKIYSSSKIFASEGEYYFKLELTTKLKNFMFEINENRAIKLYDMWSSASRAEVNGDLLQAPPIFWQDVYCLLVRYQALEGFGYQVIMLSKVIICILFCYALAF